MCVMAASTCAMAQSTSAPAASSPATTQSTTQAALKFEVGPVLGSFDDDFFYVTCRTSLAAKVYLKADSTILRPDLWAAVYMHSSEGLMHSFRVKRTGQPKMTYVLTAINGDTVPETKPATVNFPVAGQPLRFVAMGDSRTNPTHWAAVAAGAIAAKPDLIVFSGDMVADGTKEKLWEEFFAQAPELFSSIPMLVVMGNHERRSPTMEGYFHMSPADAKAINWSRNFGDTLLVGIDGESDWSAGGDNAKWLDKTLADSKAKFIFVASHYPAWSSGGHGAVDEQGKPIEKPVREAQEVIVPMLAKYHVTAYICGHEHCYERSELPGVTEIISGGAGAPLYGKVKNAEKQNPYSKVFVKTLHYCVVDVTAKQATLKAIDTGGKEIDSVKWEPRK